MRSTDASTDAGDQLTIYDLDIHDEQGIPVTLTVRIECGDVVGELIITRSGSGTTFANDVKSDLRAYFNNSAIDFAVSDTADEQPKFKQTLSQPIINLSVSSSLSAAFYGLLSLCILLTTIGIMAFIFNVVHTRGIRPCNMVDRQMSVRIWQKVQEMLHENQT